ncbi:MAG: tyrosine-type recombinase/integrase [Clostridia bacterium]|nr:tyrosine-type recombinase/integrase [Clostridia bacterium]
MAASAASVIAMAGTRVCMSPTSMMMIHNRVHDLRHTFAVNSLRAGDDIKTLQENMGHFSAAFTLDRYGHVTEEMRKASSQRMQAFIDSMTGNNDAESGVGKSVRIYWPKSW